jgi:predicted Zn-dependent protease
MDRLLNTDLAVKEYPGKYLWPPKYMVMPQSAKIINAFATASESNGATFDKQAGKIRPVVMVSTGMLKEIVRGDENSLAVIMGHEMAHLVKDHVGNQKGDTPLLAMAFGREQEFEADLNGLRYAVAAGYPYRAGVANALNAMRKRTRATSFEGLSKDHPTWEDRLALLDREQAKIWTAMSAFQNGFLFLDLEQHAAAQHCFKAVLAEFPDCHEAWANLGYALLMQYCDGLDADDLRRYGIGPIATGGFYSRPSSLESKIRGVDEKLWKEAVAALERAVALRPQLALPRASLGVAYLVHPEGKQVKGACRYFAQALERLSKDTELKDNQLSKAAVLLNSGVADLAAGDTALTRDKFKQVGRILGDAPFSPLVKSLDDALVCNVAYLEARSDQGKAKACALLERYLVQATPDSAWWQLAYAHYVKLGKETAHQVKAKEDLARRKGPTYMRLLVSVPVGSDAIHLSEPAREAVARLGTDAVEQPLFPASKLVRWRSAARGIDVLAKDTVLAIFLTNTKAPPVRVRATDVGSKGRELRVGMTEKEAQAILKDQRAEKSKQVIADPKVSFLFYPELGLGVRFASNRVEELVIAQIPRRSFFDE